MHYFLDFDRTLFDTPAFKKAIRVRPTVLQLLREFKEVIREAFGPSTQKTRLRIFNRTWGTFLSHGRFAFTPDQLKGFLYPDVAPFLATHSATVVTYGVRAFITAKVTAALTDLPLTEVIYTSRKKGRTIRKLCEKVGGPCTFIDDAHFQLESVARYCPDIDVIEMRRDDQKGDGRWRVIRSLDELPD